MAVDSHLEKRRRRYFKLNSELSLLDDRRLAEMFEAAGSQEGWGKNHTLEVAGHKVFVKRVPLTDLEFENPFSTRNLYGMPTYYNYGVGSAGFGVYRELVANIRTTNWVLDGETELFPLLYHYRICRSNPRETPVDLERHQKYVDYWGGDENISRYILDRASASHELVLFLEYFPHTLHPWLRENPKGTATMLDQLGTACEFLRRKGVIHFDAHLHNVVTDGKRPYLTDFGLVLDRSFDLSAEERAFFDAHTFYDFGEVLSCLLYLLEDSYEASPDEAKRAIMDRCGIAEGTPAGEIYEAVLQRLPELHKAGMLTMDSLVRYLPVVTLMRDFYSSLRANSRKDTAFPRRLLKRRLVETGFVPSKG